MSEPFTPDWSRSKAVLLGTAKYRFLNEIQAAGHSLNRMHQLLTGPLCGWPGERVNLLRDQERPGDLPDQLIDLYSQVKDVALFYFVGHAQLDDEDQLCLGLMNSRNEASRRATTSLTFSAVRRALRVSPAAVKIVILDCCFAGQAVHGPHTLSAQDPNGPDLTTLTGATGAYTLAATGPYSTAWFEADPELTAPHTYFTKHFAEAIERGLPGRPEALTLDMIYRHVSDELVAGGRPTPTRSNRDFADTFAFARNAAPTRPQPAPASSAPTDLHDVDRRTRLLDAAESAARLVADADERAAALARVAITAAGSDSHRARRLVEDALRLTSPGIPEGGQYRRAWFWMSLGKAIGMENPDQARTFLDKATSLTLSGLESSRTRFSPRNSTLTEISSAWFVLDPDRAERTARDIDPEYRDLALANLARAAAPRDTDRAERLARSISDRSSRMRRLADLANVLAVSDPTRAQRLIKEVEQLGDQLANPAPRSAALRGVVENLAADPGKRAPWLIAEAERIAASIPDAIERAVAYTAIAVLSEHRSGRFLRSAQRCLPSRGAIRDNEDEASAMEGIVEVMGAIDPEKAISLARRIDIDDPYLRDRAFMHIVSPLAQLDATRAEDLAREITDLQIQAQGLAVVALASADNDPENSAWLMENAKRVARASHRREAYLSLASILADRDPGAAERLITDVFSDPALRDEAWRKLVPVVGERDPVAAEALAGKLDDATLRCEAFLALASLGDRRQYR